MTVAVWALECACDRFMLAYKLFHRGHFDIVVTMTITWALSCLFVHDWKQTNRDGAACWQDSIVCRIIAAAKGLIGIVILLGNCHLSANATSALVDMVPAISLWGLPLTCVVAGLWYAQ